MSQQNTALIDDIMAALDAESSQNVELIVRNTQNGATKKMALASLEQIIYSYLTTAPVVSNLASVLVISLHAICHLFLWMHEDDVAIRLHHIVIARILPSFPPELIAERLFGCGCLIGSRAMHENSCNLPHFFRILNSATL